VIIRETRIGAPPDDRPWIQRNFSWMEGGAALACGLGAGMATVPIVDQMVSDRNIQWPHVATAAGSVGFTLLFGLLAGLLEDGEGRSGTGSEAGDWGLIGGSSAIGAACLTLGALGMVDYYRRKVPNLPDPPTRCSLGPDTDGDGTVDACDDTPPEDPIETPGGGGGFPDE
ncbi:MAG: hypothetical protein Q7S00_04820, partial [bacterium]|nr:hypothetical protein [bacterium]